MKTVLTWHCLGPPTVPPTECPETGTTDAGADKHTRTSKHTTVTTMKEAPK